MSDHYYGTEPECVFCGAFGPIDDNQPCVTRRQIGRQVAFLISKIQRLKNLACLPNNLPTNVEAIILEHPNWVDEPEYIGEKHD